MACAVVSKLKHDSAEARSRRAVHARRKASHNEAKSDTPTAANIVPKSDRLMNTATHAGDARAHARGRLAQHKRRGTAQTFSRVRKTSFFACEILLSDLVAMARRQARALQSHYDDSVDTDDNPTPPAKLPGRNEQQRVCVSCAEADEEETRRDPQRRFNLAESTVSSRLTRQFAAITKRTYS